MTISINTAFNYFMKNFVNLDSEDTKQARLDRELLRIRIQGLQTSTDHFPSLYTEADINFGSFSRRTKIRPLDDVDMFFCINADESTYEDIGSENLVITVNKATSNLYRYTNDDNKTLNSIKILNKFKVSLENIYQYRSSNINRRRESVVLSLLNKDWSFDIVPCFKTTEAFGRTYYLIPDGNGLWKKADPRIDQERATRLNKAHDGNLLNVIRLVKLWNSRPTMPSIGSYLLETMILDYYENRQYYKCTSYVDLEIPRVFEYIRDNIYYSVDDPKGLQNDLNNLPVEDRVKIWSRANSDLAKAIDARKLEENSSSGTHRECMTKWREIFGANFPEYG